jgi:hypothetical protein
MFNTDFLNNNPAVLIMIATITMLFIFYTLGRIVQNKLKFTLGNNFFALSIGAILYYFITFV